MEDKCNLRQLNQFVLSLRHAPGLAVPDVARRPPGFLKANEKYLSGGARFRQYHYQDTGD